MYRNQCMQTLSQGNFDTVWQAITYHAQSKPSALALADINGGLTYSQLERCLQCGTKSFVDQGIGVGSRVLVRMDSTKECVIIYYALMRSGATAIPVSHKAGAESIAHIMEVSQASFAVGISSLPQLDCSFLHRWQDKDHASDVIVDFSTKAICSEIIFTSGTTGKSKGVMLTARAAVQGGLNTLAVGFKSGSDTELLTTPLYHSQALNTLRANFLVGAGSIISSSYINAETIRTLLKRYLCNAVNVVPASIKLWLQDFGDYLFVNMFSQLQYIEIGAAVMDLPTKMQLLRLLPRTALCFNYGATECSRTVFNIVYSPEDKLQALGRVTPTVQMQLLDDDFKPINECGQIGKLAFKGNMIMQGYAGNPQASAEVLRDGWYISGDLAKLSSDGYIYILGRADDVINMGGQKISPQELEDVFAQVSGVTACCCVGVEDPLNVLGKIPVLFYTGSADFSIELKRQARLKLDRYKRPKMFIKLDALPVNAIAKVDRRKLRELWKTYSVRR